MGNPTGNAQYREVEMAASHIEFASDVAGTRCPGCARDTAREAVLVNSFGLVLARGAFDPAQRSYESNVVVYAVAGNVSQ